VSSSPQLNFGWPSIQQLIPSARYAACTVSCDQDETSKEAQLMGRFKVIVSAAVATVVMSATYAAAQSAVLPDRMTFVTISAPVSVPGMVLPAGEYMFRLADTQASRNVIQIYDKDRSKLFATLITVSAERNEPSDESVITFRETPSDQPPALRYWYYAGEKGGQEFAYPKDQAIRIARASCAVAISVQPSKPMIM